MLDKKTQNSTTSFLVSFLVHLLLLLLISGFWFVGKQGRSIQLTGATEASTDFNEISVDLDLEALEDPLRTEPALEPKFEEEMVMDHDLQLTEFVNSAEISFDEKSFDGVSSEGGAASRGSSSGASFFGLAPTGNRIVYIIDISMSMGEGKYKQRLKRAIDEVVSSVNNLKEDQEFFVVLFSFGTFPIELKRGMEFSFATEENKLMLESRLSMVGLSGGTDPRDAIVRALNLKPSCIFLLTDGEFNGNLHRNPPYGNRIDAYQLSVKHNKSKCPINTVGLEDRNSQAVLTRISEKSGGTYVFVPAED